MCRIRPCGVHAGTAALCILGAGLVGGCAALPGFQSVAPFGNKDVAELSADQVVDLMRRAGFSDEEVLDLGVDLRNALAINGGARIRRGEQTRGIFVVHGGYVYAAVQGRGNIIFPLSPRPQTRPSGGPGEPAPLSRKQAHPPG